MRDWGYICHYKYKVKCLKISIVLLPFNINKKSELTVGTVCWLSPWRSKTESTHCTPALLSAPLPFSIIFLLSSQWWPTPSSRIGTSSIRFPSGQCCRIAWFSWLHIGFLNLRVSGTDSQTKCSLWEHLPGFREALWSSRYSIESWNCLPLGIHHCPTRT